MIWVNGEPAEQFPVNDRGLLYGDGVWETLAVRDGNVQLLAEHLSRLQKGLHALAINTDNIDLNAIAEQAQACSRDYSQAAMKIIVTRGVGQRGYNPATATKPTIIIEINERPAATPEALHHEQQGITLGLCSHTRLAHQPLLAGFKHLNRLEQVLARAEMHAQCQEALVLDYTDNVIEGTMSNVFFLLESGENDSESDSESEQWVTPDLTQCGIAGIMRDQVLADFQAHNIPCAIRNVSVSEALSATSLFMCNSLIGIWPVQQIFDQDCQGGASMKTREIPAMVRELQTRMKSRL